MKLYIIGRIKNSIGQIEAYKLYDPKTKEMELFAREDVVRAARLGHRIVGIEPTNEFNKDGEVIYIDSMPSYYGCRTDSLDGRGRPIGGPRVWCIISTYGFADERMYKTVNSIGEEKWLMKGEVEEGLAKHEIVGAVARHNGFRLHKYCDTQDKSYEETEEFKREQEREAKTAPTEPTEPTAPTEPTETTETTEPVK